MDNKSNLSDYFDRALKNGTTAQEEMLKDIGESGGVEEFEARYGRKPSFEEWERMNGRGR